MNKRQNATQMAQLEHQKETPITEQSTLTVRGLDVSATVASTQVNSEAFKDLHIRERARKIYQWSQTIWDGCSPVQGLDFTEFKNFISYLYFSATLEAKHRSPFLIQENYYRLVLRENHDNHIRRVRDFFSEDENYHYKKAIQDLRNEIEEYLFETSAYAHIDVATEEIETLWDIYEIEACEIPERIQILSECLQHLSQRGEYHSVDFNSILQFLHYLDYKLIVEVKRSEPFDPKKEYGKPTDCNFRDIGLELETDCIISDYIYQLDTLTTVLTFPIALANDTESAPVSKKSKLF